MSWPAYLLGTLDWPVLEAFQQRHVYEISGEPTRGAVLFCDHPTGVSLGRTGSRTETKLSDEELTLRGWPVTWLPHGGGVMLHTSGQVHCYPLLNLSHFQLTPSAYVQLLASTVLELLQAYNLPGVIDSETLMIRVRGRAIGRVAVAIRRGVSTFGIGLNVTPDLELFRAILPTGETRPMTSLERECSHLRARVPTVRGQLLELLARRLKLHPWTITHFHPLLR